MVSHSKSKTAEIIWKDIEKCSEKEQRKILEWQLQAREPVYKFSDIKMGDHCVKKSSIRGTVDLYYHHFLCIGSKGKGRPTIIHYYNNVRNAFLQFRNTKSFGSGSALGQLGIIQEVTLPHEDFIASESDLQKRGAEVEKVVWPDELRRYSVEEVIKRARRRKDENYYHLAKNNCESFVMWCLCGLNLSLQSTPLVLSLSEFVSGGNRTVFQALQQLPKVITESIERVLGRTVFRNAIAKEGWDGTSCLRSIFGVVFTLLVEAGYAAYGIYEAKQKLIKGVLIKSREEFIKEIIEVLLVFFSRSGASIGGMFLGQAIIPIPFVGGIIGQLVGTLSGHCLGKGISKTHSNDLAAIVEKTIKVFE